MATLGTSDEIVNHSLIVDNSSMMGSSMAESVERTPEVVDAGAGKGGPRGQQVVVILRSAIM